MRWSESSTRSDADADQARRDPGLRVEPVRVGRGRSTTGLILCVAILAALGVAILKPWTAAVPATTSTVPGVAADTAPSTRPQPTDVAGAGRSATPSAVAALPVTRAIRLGDWTVLSADVDQLAGQPIVTERDLGGTNGDGTCGGTARITPYDELFAIVAEPGERVAEVRLFAIDSIRRPDIPTRIWTDRAGPLDGRTLDRLTVVALPRGGIAPRQYALIAETTSAAGPSRLTYTICVA